MEKKCKNKKCGRILPTEYKRKYCENCTNKRVETVKKIGHIAATGVGVIALAIFNQTPKSSK